MTFLNRDKYEHGLHTIKSVKLAFHGAFKRRRSSSLNRFVHHYIMLNVIFMRLMCKQSNVFWSVYCRVNPFPENGVARDWETKI